MIKGIGVDIIDIRRMKKIIEKDDSFVQKIFAKKEILYCNSKAKKAHHYAARFAAKEAFFKALGSGFRGSMKWKDVWVENNKLGKPEIKITGATSDCFKKKKFKRIHLSISHAKEYAVSFVILE